MSELIHTFILILCFIALYFLLFTSESDRNVKKSEEKDQESKKKEIKGQVHNNITCQIIISSFIGKKSLIVFLARGP
jgi:hypothetical protein